MSFGIERARFVPGPVRSLPAASRWRPGAGACFALGGALAALLVLAAVFEPDAIGRLTNRFHAVHLALGAALATSVLAAGAAVVGGAVAKFAGAVELVRGLALGGAAMGMLPAALPAEPAQEQPRASEIRVPSHAESEIQAGIYGGGSKSPRSDVFLKAPDGTDITLKQVQWKAEPFKSAIYYGLRGVDWSARRPRLGAMVDFTHAKATAIRSQHVRQSGMREGKPVPPTEPITKTFRKLEFTHGLNFLTINAVYRFSGWRRRTIPYLGLGIGFVIPHTEAWRAGHPRETRYIEARISGLAYQAFAGIEWKMFVSDRWSGLSEYRLTRTHNDVGLHDGGRVKANILVHQANLGIYRSVWRQSDLPTK